MVSGVRVRGGQWAAVMILLAGVIVAVAAPAHAATANCTVNGVQQQSESIVGTDGPDEITCLAGLDYSTTVDGRGGDDKIYVGGNRSNRNITSIGNKGRILGGPGNDEIVIWGGSPNTCNSDGVPGNSGTVEGGPGSDTITITGGAGSLGPPYPNGTLQSGEPESNTIVDGGPGWGAPS
ncbi:hypothetical protein AB0M22_21365 [Nocardia sp. NPDC051756]|uniref:hypothetical protein n=1 Tax=Nocardia sp. NPDC051756 TaxID=3154751 RepID=UPI00342B5F5A